MAGAHLTVGALDGVKTLGLDTAPLIQLTEQHQFFGPPVLEVARQLDLGHPAVVASTLILCPPRPG